MDGQVGTSEGEVPQGGDVATSEAPKTVSTEKSGGFLGRFFKRGKVPEVSPPADNQAPETPKAEDAAPSGETVQDPEALKESLRSDLMKVVDLQVEAHFKEDDIRTAPSRSSEDPEFMKEKIEHERVRTEVRELSEALIGRLDSARGILGNFCAVVGEGKRAVIFRAPLIEEITKTVVRSPNTGGTNGEPLYKTEDTAEDYFYINGEGVFKDTVIRADAHRTESVGNAQFDHIGSDGASAHTENEKYYKRCYDFYERDWHANVGLALISEKEIVQDVQRGLKAIVRGIDGKATGIDPSKKGAVDVENASQLERRMYALRRLTDPYVPIEGEQKYDSALAEPLFLDGDSLGGKSRVATSFDVAAAFDASVEAGKNCKGDTVPGLFFEGQPNPVPAEPMSTTPSELESVPTEVLQTPTDATSAEMVAGEVAPDEKQASGGKDAAVTEEQAAATEGETPDPTSTPSSDFTQS